MADISWRFAQAIVAAQATTASVTKTTPDTGSRTRRGSG
jgi:hypothetical protein